MHQLVREMRDAFFFMTFIEGISVAAQVPNVMQSQPMTPVTITEIAAPSAVQMPYGATTTARPGPVQPVNGADYSMAQKVRNTVMTRDVALSRMIDVSAENGRVYLRGQVPTSADRDRAASLARDAAGNLNVENQLTTGRDTEIPASAF